MNISSIGPSMCTSQLSIILIIVSGHYCINVNININYCIICGNNKNYDHKAFIIVSIIVQI